nr:MAG TPA: hypothetical protein [Crassvirales sp.]
MSIGGRQEKSPRPVSSISPRTNKMRHAAQPGAV